MSDSTTPGSLGRVGVLIVLALFIALAVFVNRPSEDRRPQRIPDRIDVAQVGAATYGTPDTSVRNRSVPRSAALDAASVTWFCGGATSRATTIVLTNRASRQRTVVATSVSSSGRRATTRVTVPGFTTRNLRPLPVAGGTLGVVLESRHGGIVAAQRVTGQGSTTTAACASTSSAQWFFAGGDTQRGATSTVVLFNPFDDLATADVTFLTPDGFRRPQATQGLAVPGRSVVPINVADVQNRRSDLGIVVTTRAGRLIAWRNQSFDGSGPGQSGNAAPRGVSVTLGAQLPISSFVSPTIETGTGLTPRVILANPGATAASVKIRFLVDNPATNGQPPETTVDLISGAVEVLGPDQLRQVAGGVPFSVAGDVVKGGAVVAEVWLDGAEPAAGHGSSASVMTAVAARGWFASTGLELPVADQLGVASSGRAARVRLWVVTDGSRRRVPLGANGGMVPAGGRITLNLATLLRGHPGAAVMLEATTPVTVSRLQTGPAGRGLVTTPAVPVDVGLTDP